MVFKIKKEKIFFLILFMYVSFARTLNLINTNFVFITLATIYILFFKRDLDLFYLLIIFLIPNLNLFLFNGIPLINILIAISLLWLFFSKKIYLNRRENNFFIFIVIFIAYDLIHFLFNDYFNIFENIILYLSILSAYFFYIYLKKENSMEKYLNYFIYGTMSSLISGLLFMISTGKFSNGINITNRNLGNAGDPNYLGLYILISIIFLINQIKENGFSFNKLLIIIFLGIGGFSTSSRSFMLLLIIEILPFIYILFVDFIKKFKLKKILLIGIAIVICVFFLRIFSENIDFIYSRFDNATNLNELTNGRSDIAMLYLNKLTSSGMRTLFGYGINKYPVNMEIFEYAHNAYIEILVTVGIIGVLSIIFLLIYVISTVKIKIWSIKFLPIIIFCIISFSINIVEVECFYFLIVIIFKYSSKNKFNYDFKGINKMNDILS